MLVVQRAGEPVDATIRWRYIWGGKRRHALLGVRSDHWGAAICGVEGYGGWRGDASQEEREKVAQLPKCQRCAKALDLR